MSSGLTTTSPPTHKAHCRRGSDPADRAIDVCDPVPACPSQIPLLRLFSLLRPACRANVLWTQQPGIETQRFAPLGREEPSNEEARTAQDLARLGQRELQNATDPYRNVNEPMSQYFTAIALLLLVLSPPLVPAIIGLVHQTILGVRAVNSRRQRAVAPSLS